MSLLHEVRRTLRPEYKQGWVLDAEASPGHENMQYIPTNRDYGYILVCDSDDLQSIVYSAHNEFVRHEKFEGVRDLIIKGENLGSLVYPEYVLRNGDTYPAVYTPGSPQIVAGRFRHVNGYIRKGGIIRLSELTIPLSERLVSFDLQA